MSGNLPPGCTACDGEGHTVRRVTVYEHGCGFPHDDGEEVRCGKCNGTGGWLDDAEEVPPEEDMEP